MKDSQQTKNTHVINNQQKPQRQRFKGKIPLVYMWFGPTVPQDYMLSLSQTNFPFVFLKNPQLQRNFSRQILDIQKGDYYKLQYIYQNGGIYSDFDNTFDYNCLLDLLKPYTEKDFVVFSTDNIHTRNKTNQITLNLFFSPFSRHPVLRKILDAVDETKPKIWQFAGMKHVAQFKEPIQLDMSKCLSHSYDWSWFQESNDALKREAPGTNWFLKKKVRKAELIKQRQYLEKIVQEKKITLENIIIGELFIFLVIVIIGLLFLLKKKNNIKYKISYSNQKS